MNEAQRQSYLRALGLTPWVARTTLPGAAPSEPLDWAAETDAGESLAAAPVEATPVRTAPGVGDAEQPAGETPRESRVPVNEKPERQNQQENGQTGDDEDTINPLRCL